jgi:hypothetical protein
LQQFPNVTLEKLLICQTLIQRPRTSISGDRNCSNGSWKGPAYVRFGSLADILRYGSDVRFTSRKRTKAGGVG